MGTLEIFGNNFFSSVRMEEKQPNKNLTNILWLEKKQDKLLSGILKFISLLPYDRCYVITDALEEGIKQQEQLLNGN